jgi:predicted tellurium resistance membrane protein TerC
LLSLSLFFFSFGAGGGLDSCSQVEYFLACAWLLRLDIVLAIDNKMFFCQIYYHLPQKTSSTIFLETILAI